MVDSWYCLDWIVPEGMSQVSRRSEVAYINGAPSIPGYLLALLRELSQCPRGLTEITKPKQAQKWTWHIFCTSSKKGLENRSSRFEPKISWISFSRGSRPPLLTGNRNPEWWGDFSQLQIQIKQKSQFEFVPQDTSEFKPNQNLNSTLYREIPRNLIFSILTNWLKSPHHSRFRLPRPRMK